jgi:holo-[acyl-carrier protein] synthase
MILGIGTDIADFAPFRAAVERSGQRFLDRIFTPVEQSACRTRLDPVPCLCARFAAKEALAKALRLGIFRAGLLNMEVRNRDDGSPWLALHGSLAEHVRGLGGVAVQLSLSHGTHSAVAFVVVESRAGAGDAGPGGGGE